MAGLIQQSLNMDRGLVRRARVLKAALHHLPPRVCRDSSEFLSRQLSLHLRIDTQVVLKVGEVIGEPFSTNDIAGLLCAEEYQVRAAVGWLLKNGKLQEVGERVFRTRRLGKRYTAKLYMVVGVRKEADFDLLNRVLCGALP